MTDSVRQLFVKLCFRRPAMQLRLSAFAIGCRVDPIYFDHFGLFSPFLAGPKQRAAGLSGRHQASPTICWPESKREIVQRRTWLVQLPRMLAGSISNLAGGPAQDRLRSLCLRLSRSY